MPVLGRVHGETVADLLEDNQAVIGKLTRASLDIIGSQAAGQKFVHQSIVNDAVAKSNFDNGLDVIYKGNMHAKDAIYVSNVEPPSPIIYDIIGFNQREAESITGIKAFNSGINGNELGSVATGVRATMNSVAKRNLSILRRINKMFEEMARMTIAMNQKYLRDEEIIRITNDEYAVIKRDELVGQFDIRVEVSTAESDNERAQELSFMLQTIGNNADPRLVATIWAKIARLRKMPDLADKIEMLAEEGSKPDPVQEQLRQIQMENAMLQNHMLKKEMEDIDSKIIERLSRSDENELDQAMKKAKAVKEMAQAKKLEADTDRVDSEVMEKLSGADVEKEMVKDNNRKDVEALMKENEMLKQMLNEVRNRINGEGNGNRTI
jgi:hypothetical protein